MCKCLCLVDIMNLQTAGRRKEDTLNNVEKIREDFGTTVTGQKIACKEEKGQSKGNTPGQCKGDNVTKEPGC